MRHPSEGASGPAWGTEHVADTKVPAGLALGRGLCPRTCVLWPGGRLSPL